VILYPAIDIRGGRCVRLVEGDFARETVFDTDPADAARRWVDAGAEWLHVVDLDGAVAGAPSNGEAIARVRGAVDVPIQLGGGLRRLEELEGVFSLGINRAILGTVALRDPDLVSDAVGRWGEAIAVALDARDGRVATDGWLEQSDAEAVDVARTMAAAGVQHLIVTDISRDGTLAGPNLDGLKQVIDAVDAGVIVSGGMSSLSDLEAAAAIGAVGAIIGRALYDGRIDLREALNITRAARAQR
jgi:phosphoribosylformimino-5-aminoimidazole carboxamide ribotide isomerase